MSLSDAVRAGAGPQELAAAEVPAEFLAAHLRIEDETERR